ncbi:hypothetical protein JT358_16525 [Micrococcales bacterium 31B]|nr:hypothetical protein [Micrococcales bacterium 31B]
MTKSLQSTRPGRRIGGHLLFSELRRDLGVPLRNYEASLNATVRNGSIKVVIVTESDTT